ncbi:hypothetical protein KPL71_023357 [Citrus sinensis]|uniref:Uncharacterized protein n=2 Tax=Citrus sinensis TaxID=2711 RepID=A0ACB8IIB5_CITSI|nr:hypothetical protein KPL71_023357 [Citrus sinensis]
MIFASFGFQMGILPMCILLALLLAVNFCHGDDGKTVEVVGSAEFAASNIKPSEAFSGLRVTIDCKPENGNGWSKTRGLGQFYVEGKFKVPLLEEIVADGKLKPTFGWAKNRKLKFSSPIRASVYYYTLPPPRRPPIHSPPVRISRPLLS